MAATGVPLVCAHQRREPKHKRRSGHRVVAAQAPALPSPGRLIVNKPFSLPQRVPPTPRIGPCFTLFYPAASATFERRVPLLYASSMRDIRTACLSVAPSPASRRYAAAGACLRALLASLCFYWLHLHATSIPRPLDRTLREREKVGSPSPPTCLTQASLATACLE